jgi:hypothetical protein
MAACAKMGVKRPSNFGCKKRSFLERLMALTPKKVMRLLKGLFHGPFIFVVCFLNVPAPNLENFRLKPKMKANFHLCT